MPTNQNMKLAFPGTRGEFLVAQMDDYAKAMENGSVPDIVAGIQRRFFKRFPITLDDKDEPTPEWLAQVDDNAADPEIQAPDENSMTPDEFSVASADFVELMNRLEKKKDQIARRLAYMYKKQNGPVEKDVLPSDTMALFKAKMGAGNFKKPRMKIPFNVWAANNRPIVDVEFAKRVVGVSVTQHAQLRSAVYKELFEALPDIEQQGVIQETAAEHALAMKEYEARLKSGASTLPEDRQRAIEYVPKFVEPILDTIAEYTGWKWSLQGGGPEPAKGGRLSMISVHSGYTSGAVKMNFGRAERKAFRTQIMPLFGSFMKKCWTVEECKARALPPDHAATQVEELCAGEQWSVAYDVEDDDDDDDHADHAIPAHTPALRKVDEQVRAMDRARAAAKKFSTPSTASTRMPSVIAAHPTSTTTSIIGAPAGPKRTRPRKGQAPVRQRPEKIAGARVGATEPPATSTSKLPHPQAAKTPQAPLPIHPALQHASQSRQVSHPPSPVISRGPSPNPSQAPLPHGRPHSPMVSRAPSPIVSRAPSPTVSRAPSPTVSPTPSLIVSSPPSPMASHTPSPIISRTASPGISHPPSPVAPHTRTPSHSVSYVPHTPIISPPPSPSVSPSSVHSAKATSNSVSAASGTGLITKQVSLVGQNGQRISSGAVAVPDVSIPAIGSGSRATGTRKRKAANSETDTEKSKRVRPSTPQPGPSGAWDVAVPADSPDWVLRAIKLLTRDDFGASWRGLVDDWLRYEHASSFADTGRLSSKGRPRAVADWIQRARLDTFRPKINVTKFKGDFEQWWQGLGAGFTGIHGVNGFLSILAALVFWRDGLKPAGMPAADVRAWSDAVDSARGVLKKLN